MKVLVTAALAAGLMATPLLATPLLVTPALAQSSSPQQLLQGLLTGNQNQDQAVRDAFERGYRAGRQDEARMQTSNGHSSRYDSGDRYNQDRGANNGNDYPSSRGSGYSR